MSRRFRAGERGASVVFRRNSVRALALALAACALTTAAHAESVEKKWRLGVAVGFSNITDSVDSNSANEMFTLNPCAETSSCVPGAELVVRAFRDPRNDSEVFGSLDINSAPLGSISAQYGFTKTFLIEGSIGYQKADVGDVEVAAQLFGNPSTDPNIDYNFVTRRVSVGELERVPIQITALKRLRPRAKFNPYFGAGVGYSLVGLSLDPEFQSLSRNLDGSRGRQLRLEPFFAVSGPSGNTLNSDGLPQLDLRGASVDARDTFEWHLPLGAEMSFKRRWSAFIDARWVDASKSVSIGFNNSDELGNSVPSFAPFDDSPIANARYGPSDVGRCSKNASGDLDQNGQPVICSGGGIIDFGYVEIIPTTTAPPGTNCKTNSSDISSPFCTANFVFDPDGVPDPALYYAQGGSVDYDGLALQFGVRMTFGK